MTKPKNMTHYYSIFFLLMCLSLLPNLAKAAIITYEMNLDGAQEVGVGDPDGIASGTISLDDVTGLVSWDLMYENIQPPVAMHVHGPGGFAGVNAGVFFGMGVATTGGANTLINSIVINVADINLITANPTGFYINIHTAEFPPGAVRGQLGNLVSVPEPSIIVMFALGLMLLGLRTLKTIR